MSAAPLLRIPLADAAEAYRCGWAAGWHIPERVPVWQWADEHRILPRETSKEPGRWRTDRNPPLRAIMESLSPHSGAEEVTFVAGTQIGKTETGTNFVGYVIDHEPATIVVVEPTSTLGKVWRRQRFDPLTELTPAVGARIGNRRSRDSNNTLEAVKFPGGWLIVAHAESAASLSMYSARYLFLDEVDSYPLDTGGEGDPLRTAKDLLLDRLALSVHKPKDQRWFHLPADMPDAWFAGITLERRDPETERWVPVKLSKVRNEDIDTLVYAYAAATHPRVGLPLYREADWTRLEQHYQPPVRDLFAVADVPENAVKRPSDAARSTRMQPMPPAPGVTDGRSSR